jgi:hypothetical protein
VHAERDAGSSTIRFSRWRRDQYTHARSGTQRLSPGPERRATDRPAIASTSA